MRSLVVVKMSVFSSASSSVVSFREGNGSSSLFSVLAAMIGESFLRQARCLMFDVGVWKLRPPVKNFTGFVFAREVNAGPLFVSVATGSSKK